MATHPCTFAHAIGYAQPAGKPKAEAEPREPGDWTDEEIAQFASLDFQPWNTSDCPLPSNQEWVDGINPHLISLRIAWRLMGKSKAELIDIAEELQADGVLESMANSIVSTESYLRGLHDLASAAQARLFCAMTVLELRGPRTEPHQGDDQ